MTANPPEAAPERSRRRSWPSEAGEAGPVDLLCIAVALATCAAAVEFVARTLDLRLPATQQLAYLAYTILATWLGGVLLAAIVLLLSLAGVGRRIWPGWLVATGMIFVFAFSEIAAILESPHRTALVRLVLSAGCALWAFLGLRWLGPRMPGLQSVTSWSYLALGSGVLVVGIVSYRAPAAHRSGATGAWLMALVLACLLAVHLARARGRHRALGGGLCAGGLLLLIPAAAKELASPDPSSTPPAVIVISVDTLRSDHLGCYNGDRDSTPNIDRLAEEGVLFENAVTAIPLTNPSHTTMLTGLYPGNHGVVLNLPMKTRSGVHTLPRLLADRGYRTAAFVGGAPLFKWASRLTAEFEVYDDHLGAFDTVANLALRHVFPRALALLVPPLSRATAEASDWERPATQLVSAAEEWLKVNSTGPFFLFLHFFEPHGPYWPPSEYRGAGVTPRAEAIRGDWYSLTYDQREEILRDEETVASLKDLYRGEVRYVDEQIGRLVKALRTAGRLEQSLIVFTADHGESLTEHDYYFDHSVTLFEESVRVPLILRFPRQYSWRGRVTSLASLIDIFPTVLDFLGMPSPTVDGRSLLSRRVDDEPNLPREVVTGIFPPEIEGNKALLAVRTERFKYIRTLPWWNDLLSMPGREELYDLRSDPAETTDVLATEPVAAERLRSIADRYVAEWFTRPQQPLGELPERSREALRALGYF